MDARQVVATSSSAGIISTDESTLTRAEQTSPVDQLRRFISKNKIFPAVFADCEAGKYDDHLKTIQCLIRNPELKTPAVGSYLVHEYRMEMLIYLMETRQIDYWDGLSMYAYLMAIYEFGSDNVTLKKLLDDNKQLTPFAVAYLAKVKDNFIVETTKSIDVIMSALTKYLLNASSINQYCINIQFATESRFWGSSKEKFMNQLKVNLPLIGFDDSVGSRFCLFDPPRNYYLNLGMVNHLCSLLSENPVKMLPVFGRISKKTLADLHRQSWHPVALSAPCVKSNTENVHRSDSGYFLTFLHDVVHTFMANLLTEEDRMNIYKCIDGLNDLKIKCKNNSYVGSINVLIDELNDFDLSPIKSCCTMKFRLQKYLFDCLGQAKIPYRDPAAELTRARVLEVVSDYCNLGIAPSDISQRNTSP